MQLLAMNGNIIQHQKATLRTGTEQQHIDINNLAAGNYILNVQYNDIKNSYKILKNK